MVYFVFYTGSFPIFICRMYILYHWWIFDIVDISVLQRIGAIAIRDRWHANKPKPFTATAQKCGCADVGCYYHQSNIVDFGLNIRACSGCAPGSGWDGMGWNAGSHVNWFIRVRFYFFQKIHTRFCSSYIWNAVALLFCCYAVMLFCWSWCAVKYTFLTSADKCYRLAIIIKLGLFWFFIFFLCEMHGFNFVFYCLTGKIKT